MSAGLHPVQSRSLNARLLVQLTGNFEDKLREFRKSNPALAYNESALVEYMHGLVNGARARLFQKVDIDRQGVSAADTAASGHVDYEHKFALGCVELVLGVKTPSL